MLKTCGTELAYHVLYSVQVLCPDVIVLSVCCTLPVHDVVALVLRRNTKIALHLILYNIMQLHNPVSS